MSLEKIIECLELLKELTSDDGKKTLVAIQQDIRRLRDYSATEPSPYSDPLEVERHIAAALAVMRRSSFGI